MSGGEQSADLPPGRNGVVGPAEWARYRYEIADGLSAACPNIVADDDGVANGAVSCRVHLTDVRVFAGPYTVRATDSDATAAAASFEVVQQPTAQWITGRVVDGSGVPLAGAIAWAQDPAEEDAAFAITDTAGEFLVFLRSTGPHAVAAAMPGMLSSLDDAAETLDLAPGENRVSKDLVLRSGHPTFSGQVHTGGTPVPGILVVLGGEDDEDGV